MAKFLKNFLSLAVFCLTVLLFNAPATSLCMSSNNYTDPYPIYTSLDMHYFLYGKERQWLKGLSESKEKETERVGFYISPFFQFADRGRDINNNQEYLGDINGRWNMIGLLFGQTPDGQTLAPALQAAKDNIFGYGITEIDNPGVYVDPSKQFGFFAVPLRYQKFGGRVEFDLRFFKDFGIAVQTGYSCICQKQQDLCKKYDICAGVSCNNPNSCKNAPINPEEIDAMMQANTNGLDSPRTYSNEPNIRRVQDNPALNAFSPQIMQPDNLAQLTQQAKGGQQPQTSNTLPYNQYAQAGQTTKSPSQNNPQSNNLDYAGQNLKAMETKTQIPTKDCTANGCSYSSGDCACGHQGYTLPVDLTTCSSLTQMPDSTAQPSGVKTISKTNVEYYLMNQVYTITNQMDLSLQDFEKNSIEDVRFNLYWRHAIEVNKGTDGSKWSHFLCIPFAELCYCAATGQQKCQNMMFSVPFGNNGHNSIGGKAGLLIDFTETLEIGVDAGATHFFDKTFTNYRVPTSIYQSGIFPFATSVKVCPGLNCFGTFKLAAYHFLGNLSTWWQYMIVSHNNDKICLCKPDPAFIPSVLEKRSNWMSQMLNIGFNYDISPDVGLGLFCQAPLWQKRSYASCTVMASLNLNF